MVILVEKGLFLGGDAAGCHFGGLGGGGVVVVVWFKKGGWTATCSSGMTERDRLSSGGPLHEINGDGMKSRSLIWRSG